MKCMVFRETKMSKATRMPSEPQELGGGSLCERESIVYLGIPRNAYSDTGYLWKKMCRWLKGTFCAWHKSVITWMGSIHCRPQIFGPKSVCHPLLKCANPIYWTQQIWAKQGSKKACFVIYTTSASVNLWWNFKKSNGVGKLWTRSFIEVNCYTLEELWGNFLVWGWTKCIWPKRMISLRKMQKRSLNEMDLPQISLIFAWNMRFLIHWYLP